MIGFNSKSFIIPGMAKYLNEQTNKSLEKYLRKPLVNIEEESSIRVLQKNPLYIYQFLPLVVFFSFLTGYNFS